MSKMRQKLLGYYTQERPLLMASASEAVSNPSPRSVEDAVTVADLLAKGLDQLLPWMLRPDAFIEMYLDRFPALKTTGGDQIKRELWRIQNEEAGCTVFGDASFLKMANNQVTKGGEDYGDWMLKQIAQAIERLDSDSYGRYRMGDEFILQHSSTDDLLQRVEVELQQLAQQEVLPGLPIGIDFGFARDSEVAAVYLRLLDEVWVPQLGRTGIQVFLDIALRVAKLRSDIQKIYNRAWLLRELCLEVRASDPERYAGLEKELTRGGKFITPQPNWFTVPDEQVPDFLRLETLAFVQSGGQHDHFAEVCIEMAESIFLQRIIGG